VIFQLYFMREILRSDLVVIGRRRVRTTVTPEEDAADNLLQICKRTRVMMSSINLADRLSTFAEHWQPRTVAEFNGHDIMVAKLKGEFVWHRHDNTDDFFLVLKGRVTIQLRSGNVTLCPGEMFVVPKGVEHCPIAEEESHILLIEPTGTPNTGDPSTAAPRIVLQ
jgi:mannose-6-phosphate isomerase-like protein (cupin superfamily)